MENFPPITYIKRKIFHLFRYYVVKHGKTGVNFSMFPVQYTNRMKTKSKSKFKPDPKLKLMDQVCQVLRCHHIACRTKQAYCNWIVRFIKFHGS